MMSFCGRILLVLMCSCLIFTHKVNGSTEQEANNGIICHNGGTPINRNICRCPGRLFGNYCNQSLYVSFDTLENFTLMAGTEQMNFDALVQGLYNSAVSLNRSERQWIDLGHHPEVCLIHRDTCGPAGGAFSMWLKVIDCGGGIIPTRAHVSHAGLDVYCNTPQELAYNYFLPKYLFSGSLVFPGFPSQSWFHVVFNYIGPNDGFRVYHDGELVLNKNRKQELRLSSVDARIVIGTFGTGRYSLLQVDELLFFNQALTQAEIIMLKQ